ncbi:MAG: hypothetical protein HY015_02415 [Bacteroidetes bacterium]|nr:hypothetical protein [Bacteroidota bacterium]
MSELKSMDKTYQSSQKALHKITEDLPVDVQADFNKIIGKPEVMNLLTERIDLVVSLGEAYKEDPKGTKEKLDALSAQINEQNQKDLAEYKNRVESDPKMQEEMKKSAQDFANTNDQEQQNQNQPAVVNNYYSSNYSPYPYPYWFGYPYWYSNPMWYPMPLYYYTGFYVGSGGSLVVVGLPSHLYSGWFFNYGYRHYPRYYSYCNNYYTAHRRFVNNINVYRGFSTTVNNHFSRINNTRISNNLNGQGSNSNRTNYGNVNRQSRNNSGLNQNQFRNSINHSGNFDHHFYSNYHANQFHQQNWGNVRGGSFGGGNRMGGGFGNGGFGGGGHSGGHGRR